MDKNIFKGEWNQVKGKIKEKWGKLTDDDLTQISGKRDQLLGTLQKRYGYAKDRAEEDIKQFEERCAKDARDVDEDVIRFNDEHEEGEFHYKKKVG